MPRPRKFPPTIHHHASGQGMIRWKGRDYYLGKYGSPEAAAEYARLIGQIAGQVDISGLPENRKTAAMIGLTVAEVVARFQTHAKTYYSARGREGEQYGCALKPLLRLFADLPASAFGPDELRRLQQVMIDGSWMTDIERAHPTRRGKTGWSRGVVNARIKRIRTAWRWAEEAKLVPAGIWQALRAVSPVRRNRPGARDVKRARTTTLAEVKAVCRGLPPQLRAALLVQWWSGMRSCELRLMRAGEVTDSPDGLTYTPSEHKTDYLGHDRVILFGPKACAVLRPWLAMARRRGDRAPVFPSPGGRARGVGRGLPYTRSGFCRAIRTAADAAGLPHFHGYLNRHATKMRVCRLAGDEAARSVLGHQSLDTTMEIGRAHV